MKVDILTDHTSAFSRRFRHSSTRLLDFEIKRPKYEISTAILRFMHKSPGRHDVTSNGKFNFEFWHRKEMQKTINGLPARRNPIFHFRPDGDQYIKNGATFVVSNLSKKRTPLFL